MEFMKFPSLMQAENIKAVEQARMHFGDRRFVVTEKIHGSNLSVVTDGVEVKFGRRNDFLAEGEQFYGVEYVTTILRDRVLEMFKDIQDMVRMEHEACDALEADGKEVVRPTHSRDIKELRMFMEFYGGHYPHPDVPQIPNMGQVGKGGVWYAQDKSVAVFRMYIDGRMVDFYEMGALCMSYGIPVVPTLFFGTLDECLAYSHEHYEDLTTIPFMQPWLDAKGNPVKDDGEQILVLPAIEGNIREGHVIMPVEAIELPNGVVPCFKHKNKKFSESKSRGEGQATRVVQPIEQRWGNQMCAVYLALTDLMTIERLKSVMSKEQYERKDVQKVIGLVIKDGLDGLCEYSEEFSAGFDLLTTKERKALMSELTRYAMGELRDEFFKLV
ncbi:RNA ligase, Rnl2 family [Aeromonas phage 1233]|nr:RNA ligase, Rnl2 family [Aeromonas phage 1233]